jgi:hypothetical protein
MAKRIDNPSNGITNLLENCYERREETEWKLNAACGSSLSMKGIIAWTWKAVVKKLKKFIVCILLWIQLLFTH